MTETEKVTADIVSFLDALGNGADTHVTVGSRIVPHDVVLAFIEAARKGAGATWPREGAAYGHWPIRAANACIEINGANPSAVAAEIGEAFRLLQEVHECEKRWVSPETRSDVPQALADEIRALLQRIQTSGGGDG